MSSETVCASKGSKDSPWYSSIKRKLMFIAFSICFMGCSADDTDGISDTWALTITRLHDSDANPKWQRFVRRARTRLAAARDIKHPALTTSFCLDALLQDPNLSPFEQAAGLAYRLSLLLPDCGPTSQAAWQQGDTLPLKIRILISWCLIRKKGKQSPHECSCISQCTT